MGWLLECLRQWTFPVFASRQERISPTPSVKTFPSATTGVARVFVSPGAAGPGLYGAAYGSDRQISLPVATSTHCTTSSSFCRVKTYTLSPTTTGDAYPSPTGTFHSSFRVLG